MLKIILALQEEILPNLMEMEGVHLTLVFIAIRVKFINLILTIKTVILDCSVMEATIEMEVPQVQTTVIFLVPILVTF
jgi:hypothetical protein